MSTIKIGDSPAIPVAEATESWITEQVNRRRADGRTPCVIVQIRESDAGFSLATPQCGPGGGGGRQFTEKERRIVELWKENHLFQSDFTGGNVVAFVKRLQRGI